MKPGLDVSLEVAWLTTNRACNIRCQWCYARATQYDPSIQLDLEIAKRLVLILQDIGIRRFILIGGEPTIWPGLFPLNDFCRERSLTTNLVTNGLMFASDRFWGAYIQHPSDNVGVSIKAGNREQFLELAGTNGFETVKKALRRIASHIKSYGVSITYNAYYRDNLEEIVQFIMDCGATSVKIDFCNVSFLNGTLDTRGVLEPREIVADIVKAYPRLEEITGKKVMLEINTPLCLWPHEFIDQLKADGKIITVCQLLQRKGIVFDTDGSVLTCNGLFEYPIGKFGVDFETSDSLLRFLHRPDITEIYDKLCAYPSPKCTSCKQYSECGGGCPLRWTLQNPLDVIP